MYVERGVGMAFDAGVAAWVFDLDLWGVCGQGEDESSALTALAGAVGRRLGSGVELVVVERITGNELAFSRDRRPATGAQRLATLDALAEARTRTVALVDAAPAAVLDWDDPQRVLPAYANWRTLRQLAWHVADTESRYYLPRLGLEYRYPADDLRAELDASFAQVRRVVAAMPAGAVREERGQVWTSVKVLRRLAWHEPGELAVMADLAARAHAALSAG